jgi:uncharacterized membrane-anchored protein
MDQIPLPRKKFCAPLVIYLILAGISILSTLIRTYFEDESKPKVDGFGSSLIDQILSASASGLILYALCYYGYIRTAWFFLLFPLILLVIALFALLVVFLGQEKFGAKVVL